MGQCSFCKPVIKTVSIQALALFVTARNPYYIRFRYYKNYCSTVKNSQNKHANVIILCTFGNANRLFTKLTFDIDSRITKCTYNKNL